MEINNWIPSNIDIVSCTWAMIVNLQWGQDLSEALDTPCYSNTSRKRIARSLDDSRSDVLFQAVPSPPPVCQNSKSSSWLQWYPFRVIMDWVYHVSMREVRVPVGQSLWEIRIKHYVSIGITAWASWTCIGIRLPMEISVSRQKHHIAPNEFECCKQIDPAPATDVVKVHDIAG